MDRAVPHRHPFPVLGRGTRGRRAVPGVGRGPRRGGAHADEERLRAARRRGRRADAGRARRLRPADRRRPRHRERGDPIRGRRRHRLPHEDDRARPAADDPERGAGAAHRRDRARDAVRRRRRLPEASPPRGDGRRLAGVPGHRGPEGPGLGAARHERERQSLRRVRHADGDGRRGRPRARPVRRTPQPLRQPRHGRADRAALQQGGAAGAPRAAAGALAAGVARSGVRRRPGVPGRQWS